MRMAVPGTKYGSLLFEYERVALTSGSWYASPATEYSLPATCRCRTRTGFALPMRRIIRSAHTGGPVPLHCRTVIIVALLLLPALHPARAQARYSAGLALIVGQPLGEFGDN